METTRCDTNSATPLLPSESPPILESLTASTLGSEDTAPTAFLEGEIFADVCTRLNYWLLNNRGVPTMEAEAVLAWIDNDPSVIFP